MARNLEVKRITLDLRSGRDARKLRNLIEDGWTIQSEQRRSILSFGKAGTDYVFTREKAEKSSWRDDFDGYRETPPPEPELPADFQMPPRHWRPDNANQF